MSVPFPHTTSPHHVPPTGWQLMPWTGRGDTAAPPVSLFPAGAGHQPVPLAPGHAEGWGGVGWAGRARSQAGVGSAGTRRQLQPARGAEVGRAPDGSGDSGCTPTGSAGFPKKQLKENRRLCEGSAEYICIAKSSLHNGTNRSSLRALPGARGRNEGSGSGSSIPAGMSHHSGCTGKRLSAVGEEVGDRKTPGRDLTCRKSNRKPTNPSLCPRA